MINSIFSSRKSWILVIIFSISLFPLFHHIIKYRGDISAFIYFDTPTAEKASTAGFPMDHIFKHKNGEIYDGMLFYLIATNPFSPDKYEHLLGASDYRYRRIGYPLLVWLTSFGHDTIIPYSMLFVNLIWFIILFGLIYHFVKNHPHWHWLLLGGMMVSGVPLYIRMDVSDLQALVCSLLAISLLKKQIGWFLLFSTFAIFTKEVWILLPMSYSIYYLLENEKIKGLVIGIPIGLYFLWYLYVGQLFPLETEQVVHTSYSLIPLKGYILRWVELLTGNYIVFRKVMEGITLFIFLILFVYVVKEVIHQKKYKEPIGWLIFTCLFVAVIADFALWIDPAAYHRTLTIGFVLFICFIPIRHQWIQPFFIAFFPYYYIVENWLLFYL